MLNSTISKNILDHITKGTVMAAKTKVYLGLLTALPSDPSAASPSYTEVSLDGYGRIPLGNEGSSRYGLHDVAYFGTVVYDSVNGYYKAVTQEDIQMPSILETETETATVVGFGLFSADKDETGDLLAWGGLVDPDTGDAATVTLTGGSVPIFYTGDFELRLS